MKLFQSIIFVLLAAVCSFMLRAQDNNDSARDQKKQELINEDYVQQLLDSATHYTNLERYDEALTLCIEAINIEANLSLSLHARVRINDNIASALSGVEAFEYGIKHTRKSIHLLLNNDSIEAYDILWRFGRVGSFHLFNDELDSAMFYFKQALPWAMKYGRPLYIAAAYNNLGIAYSKVNHDSAFYYFDLAKSTTKLPTNESIGLTVSINDNIADLLLEDSLFTPAAKLYDWNYQAFKNMPGKDERTLNAGLQLAQTLLLKDSLETLLPLLNQLNILLDTSDHESSRILMGLWVAQSKKINDKEAELYYVKRELEELDIVKQKSERGMQAIAHRLNEYGVRRIEKQLELERLKSSTQKNLLDLTEQKAITRLIIIWTSITIMLMIILILYLNYKKKIEVRKKEQERLDSELALKKRDLEDFAMEINQKQEWTEQLSDKLVEIKNLDKEDVFVAIRNLLNEVRGAQVAEKQKKVFQQNIKDVNHQFFEKLSTHFGNLTKTERELAGLLRMELSNKEIANLRNTEVASVKRGRSRLRKKLNLSPETDIYSFLKSI